MENLMKQARTQCRLDNRDALSVLVPSMVDKDGVYASKENECTTLLSYSIVHKSDDCTDYLLNVAHASVNQKNYNGFTALHWAAYKGSSVAINLLLSAGADPNIRTADGKLPVHIAAYSGNLEFLKTVAPLSDMRAVDSEGNSCLRMAALGKKVEVAEWLIQNNYCDECKDKFGRTFDDFCHTCKAEGISEMYRRHLANDSIKNA